jgi:hypothetical protein
MKVHKSYFSSLEEDVGSRFNILLQFDDKDHIASLPPVAVNSIFSFITKSTAINSLIS